MVLFPFHSLNLSRAVLCLSLPLAACWSTTTPRPVSPSRPNLASSKEKDPAAQVWQTIATADPAERSREILATDAPDGLHGTYYINGFANCEIGDRLVHPFESHGFFKAITIDGTNNTVQLQGAKYIETPVRTWERRLGRPLFRGAMSAVADSKSFLGSLLNALSPTTRPTVNLAVRKWNQRLIVSSDNAPFLSDQSGDT